MLKIASSISARTLGCLAARILLNGVYLTCSKKLTGSQLSLLHGKVFGSAIIPWSVTFPGCRRLHLSFWLVPYVAGLLYLISLGAVWRQCKRADERACDRTVKEQLLHAYRSHLPSCRRCCCYCRCAVIVTRSVPTWWSIMMGYLLLYAHHIQSRWTK